MNTNHIITIITPALIAFVAFIIVRYFPPSIDKSFMSQAPQWWARDQDTWDKAYAFLAKKYMYYSILLAIICISLLFIDWEYGISLSYILLIVLILYAQYQVRTYMQNKIK